MEKIAEKSVKDIDEEVKWYSVGCASPQKELKVRDDARQRGLEAFVPLVYQVKTHKKQKYRALVPALPGLMFIKGTENEVKDYMNKSHFPVYMRKSTFTNKEEFLTIPTQAMENFIAVTEKNEEHITYFRPEEISLQAGDRIIVKGGLYDGREGIIMRIKGKRNKHLVVQIPGVLIAAVEMKPELIERAEEGSSLHPSDSKRPSVERNHPERPSKDVEKDKRLLMETAKRLLFEIPDKYQKENEYYLLLSELKRTKERLKTYKGYTPTSEAELALPMYLAAVKLNDAIPEAEERLRNAIDKLKDSSKLKATCIEYLNKIKIDL